MSRMRLLVGMGLALYGENALSRHPYRQGYVCNPEDPGMPWQTDADLRAAALRDPLVDIRIRMAVNQALQGVRL